MKYIVEDSRWWDAGPLLPSIQAAELQPTDTGILDSRGRKILRAPEPVGFHRASGGTARPGSGYRSPK